MKNKEIKLAEIKKHNPTLHSKVVNGSTTLQDALKSKSGLVDELKTYKDRVRKGFKVFKY